MLLLLRLLHHNSQPTVSACPSTEVCIALVCGQAAVNRIDETIRTNIQPCLVSPLALAHQHSDV